jgi:S-adenosylmethionine:tRNA ribosyltransferase-isomerase
MTLLASDFDFHLPPDRIAQAPARPRESARLLEVGAQGRVDRSVADLPSLLREGDLIVANDTRVTPGSASRSTASFPMRAGTRWSATRAGCATATG